MAKTQNDWEMDELGTCKGTNYTCNECREQKEAKKKDTRKNMNRPGIKIEKIF